MNICIKPLNHISQDLFKDFFSRRSEAHLNLGRKPSGHVAVAVRSSRLGDQPLTTVCSLWPITLKRSKGTFKAFKKPLQEDLRRPKRT